jgi:hypothetical protein
MMWVTVYSWSGTGDSAGLRVGGARDLQMTATEVYNFSLSES